MTLLIFFDLEQIVWRIRDDSELPETRKTDALPISIGAIEEAAQELETTGNIVRIAAFSVPSPFGTVPEILRALERNRYLSLVTTRGPDQADHALKSMTSLVLNAGCEDACLFVTGDGRDPYPDLVRYARSQQRQVHLAAYAAIPPSLATYSDTSPILLAGRIAKKFSQSGDVAIPEPVEKRPSRPPVVESAQKLASSRGRTPINPHHHATIKTLVTVVRKVVAMQRKDQWTFGELMRAIIRYWPDTPPPEEDVRAMFKSISYRLFEEWRVLKWHPDQRFMQEIER